MPETRMNVKEVEQALKSLPEFIWVWQYNGLNAVTPLWVRRADIKAVGVAHHKGIQTTVLTLSFGQIEIMDPPEKFLSELVLLN